MRGQLQPRTLRSTWRELGRVGRLAFIGVVVSGVVAVTLGFLIPSAVEDQLLAARVDELERAALRVVESGGVVAYVPEADYSMLAEAAQLRLLGGDTVRVKLWDHQGRILWSDESRLIGRRFTPGDHIKEAFEGEMAYERSDLTELENEYEVGLAPLLEFYLPVRLGDSVEAVFEAYQRLDPIDSTLQDVRMATWVRIGSGLAVLMVFMGTLTLVTVRGVERRRRQSEALLGRSLEVREVERIRLATALHDEIGQPLYRLLFGLETLEHGSLDSTEGMAEVGRLRTMVGQIDDALRGEIATLNRSSVDSKGLAASVQELASQPGNMPSVEVSIDLDRSLGQPLEEALYRAAREAVNNAVKHSGGDAVRLALSESGGSVVLRVWDNGRWKPRGEGLGIATIQRLIEMQGGQLTIHTNGRGTTVTLSAPLGDER